MDTCNINIQVIQPGYKYNYIELQCVKASYSSEQLEIFDQISSELQCIDLSLIFNLFFQHQLLDAN